MNFGPYIPRFSLDSDKNPAQKISTKAYCPLSFVTVGSAKTTLYFGA